MSPSNIESESRTYKCMSEDAELGLFSVCSPAVNSEVKDCMTKKISLRCNNMCNVLSNMSDFYSRNWEYAFS
jgi:hypothetical protein